MANSSSDIQKLYIAYFNRPADPLGLAYWMSSSMTLKQIADSFAVQTEYATAYAGMTNAQVINTLYLNMFGHNADVAGLTYWNNELTAGKVSLGQVALFIQNGATGADKTAIDSKAAAAASFTTAVDTTPEIITYAGAGANAQAKAWLSKVVDATTLAAAQATADATIANIVSAGTPGTVLTNGTDVLSAEKFSAPQVYTPGGDDRINSLQSEDVLTGSANGTNRLDATLGNSNDNGSASVTPTLNNIQTINVDATGNTKTLDLRNADDVKTLAVNKMTAEASSFTFNNISMNKAGSTATDLTVKNTSGVATTVSFKYADGVLAKTAAAGVGGDSAKVNLSNVTLSDLYVGQSVGTTEGFEQVELNSVGTNTVKTTTFVDLENLVIKGSGALNMVNTDTSASTEKVTYTASGLGIGNGIGIRTIDATGFTGNVNLDITNALGGHNDPANSGATYYTSVKMGAGNDVLWTNTAGAGTSTIKDAIDGGAGADTLRTYAGVGANVAITNVETLEMRGNSASSDISSFDASLKKVILRNENTANAAQTFTLNKVTAALAVSDIELRHSVTNSATETGTGDTVVISLASSSGTADAAALTVVNDLNKGTTYNYALTASGVETVTINDNDTETNQLTLNSVSSHKTAVNLTGGTAGLDYVVKGTVIAKTLDASTQKSNLTLTVGAADQTIKLGSGNDMLTFDGLDTFNGSDTLTDAGGTDTVRAAFSKDVTGTPSLTGIEKLQIVATENTTIDLANGVGITELALLSDFAVDEAGEIFTAGVTSVQTTDIITLKNTNLTSVNFFGDTDAKTGVDGNGNGVFDSLQYTQTFNGLTLNNNASATLAVNISAPLTNANASTGDGIKAYNLGQLTTHGVTDMTIAVANEFNASKTGSDYSGDTTTISNIWDRDLVNLTLSAKGNVNVGTVTGNTVNSNIKKFDASAVGGKVTAVVKALGDNAVVTLAGGDDSFNALGSAGNNVTINGGNGKNVITGTAQSDYIYTGTGNDTINADRGNNTVKSGAGNDTVTALNGSNTVDLGSGWADSVTFNYDTAGQQNLATNVVAGSGTSGLINIVNGGADGLLNTTGDNVTTTYGFAVGDGAELSVKFTGITFDAVASTFNGRSVISGAATNANVMANANYNANLSNAVVFTDTVGITAGQTFTGGSVADVFLDYTTGVGVAYNVSGGAGNDAVVISQTSTAAHTITGGAGADRVYLSAAAGVDTIVIGENDSTATGWDVISNFTTGADKLDLSGVPTAGVSANLSSLTIASGVTATAVAGLVTVTGAVVGSSALSLASMVSYLANNATVNGDVFFFQYDSNGDGAITATDNVVVFQNLGTDIVVELVGGNGINVNGFAFGDMQ